MKRFNYLILLVSFICFSSYSNEPSQGGTKAKSSILGKRKAKTVSEKAIQKIEKIVVSFVNEGRDIKDKNVQDAILHQVNSMYPLDKSVKAEEVNISKIEKEADLKAQEKYTFNREELREKYKKEADQKFKAVPINTKITVEFVQGPNLRKVSGIYYGLTHDQGGIRVGRRVVPMIDLVPEAKVKFDKIFRNKKKQEYINKHIAKDLSIRGDYAMTQAAEAVNAVVKKNEDAGYIFAWNKWRTPEEVARIIIKYYSRSQ